MLRVIDRRLFISGLWTALSVLPYTIVLFILELVRPGAWVFLSNSTLRHPFLVTAVISWPFLLIGAAICCVLAITTIHTHPRDLDRYTLVCACIAFLSLAAGTSVTIAGACLVFVAFKDKLARTNPEGPLKIIIPVLMGIVPAVFYLVWVFGYMISFVSGVYMLVIGGGVRRGREGGDREEGRRRKRERDIETGRDGRRDEVLDATLGRREHNEEIAKTTFSEKLEMLREMGFEDKTANMHALHVCDYSIEEAARKLRSGR